MGVSILFRGRRVKVALVCAPRHFASDIGPCLCVKIGGPAFDSEGTPTGKPTMVLRLAWGWGRLCH